jgi:hypothetical protein
MVALVVALVAVEIAAVVLVALLYQRRRRTLRAAEAVHRLDEVVLRAVRLGTRARDPRLSVPERTGLLEETHAALDEARQLLDSLPRRGNGSVGSQRALPAPRRDERAA